MMKGPLASSPRVMMIVVGLLIGFVSGVVIGVLALVGGKLVKAPPSPESKATA